MALMSVTPAGATAFEREVMERAERPIPVMVQAELARLTSAEAQGRTTREESIAQLSADVATVQSAMGILRRLGSPVGLTLPATMRCAEAVLTEVRREVEPVVPELVADIE